MSLPAAIQTVLLQDGDVCVRVLSIGCAVQSWTVAGVPVLLGYANTDDYRSNPFSMSTVIGRVVNRISNASFELQGQQYELSANAGIHHIHGGSEGLGWRVWHTEVLDQKSVRFSCLSEHLDQGYPGQVQFSVELRLEGHTLSYDMRALPDRLTPINMAQHHYFNLMGEGDIREHELRIAASRYTPTDAQAFPLGTIEPVEHTIYDFRQARTIADADPQGLAHDASLIVEQEDRSEPIAEVNAANGLRLRMWSDQPCVQLYTSGTLTAHGTPGEGAAHQRFAALCLEAQNFPDAMAHPNFASILHSPDNPYHQQLAIEIAPQ